MIIFGLNFSQADLYLLSIAGVLTMYLLGLRLPGYIRTHNIARHEFRKAFDDTIFNIRENLGCPIAQFSYAFHDGHLSAIIKYREHIPMLRRKNFDKAVENYKKAYDMAQEYGSVFAVALSENSAIARQKREIYKNAVYHLLSYA